MQRLRFMLVVLPLLALAVFAQAQVSPPAASPIALEGIDQAAFSNGEEFFSPFPGEPAKVDEAQARKQAPGPSATHRSGRRSSSTPKSQTAVLQ